MGAPATRPALVWNDINDRRAVDCPRQRSSYNSNREGMKEWQTKQKF